MASDTAPGSRTSPLSTAPGGSATWLARTTVGGVPSELDGTHGGGADVQADPTLLRHQEPSTCTDRELRYCSTADPRTR